MNRSGILLINPGFINLAVVRILNRGKIFYFEDNKQSVAITIF